MCFPSFLRLTGHVLHPVQAGTLSDQEGRGAQRALGEERAVLRLVAQGEDLGAGVDVTSWMPTVFPMRREWMPTSSFVRFPFSWRPMLNVACGRAFLTASASIRAVPLGTSILWLWCASTISMSASGKSAAAVLTSFVTRVATRGCGVEVGDLMRRGGDQLVSPLLARGAITTGGPAPYGVVRQRPRRAWWEKSMMQSAVPVKASSAAYMPSAGL
jgi:hypothetical protein